MPNNTYNLTVPAGTWTKVIDGPGGVLITGNDNFNYAYDSQAPVGVLGHFALANIDILPRPSAGQALWVYNAERSFRLTVTIEGDA